MKALEVMVILMAQDYQKQTNEKEPVRWLGEKDSKN